MRPQAWGHIRERIVAWTAVRRRHPDRDVLRHADLVLARLRRAFVHGRLHARVVARYGHAKRLRGDGEHHALVDSAVHPQRRGNRPLRRRSRSLPRHACVDAAHPGRSRHRQRLHLRAVRGDGGLESRDVLRDRQRGHSGDAQARLLARIRSRHHRRGRHARDSATAVDHDDSLRGRRRGFARAIVPCGNRAGPPSGRTVCALRRLPLPEGICGRAYRVRARR